jgi:site-specific recombinase XerD
MDKGTVERFAESLRLRGKQPATVESYCRDAQRFLDFLAECRLAPSQVEPGTLVAFQDRLREADERDNSIRRTVIGIRQFYRFLTEARILQSTPFDDVAIPTRDDTLPKGLAPDDVDAVMQVALSGRPDFKAARDAAMVSLLAHEGIKANELISLRWSDFLVGSPRAEDGAEPQRMSGATAKDDPAALAAAPRATLRVAGPRARVVPVSAETTGLLVNFRRHYDSIRHPVIAQAPDKRLFIAFKGRDAASPLPEMTRHGLKFVIYELGQKAGISKLNTEQLRHYAVSWHLALGRSPEDIMALLGLRRIGNIAKHLARSRGGRDKAAPARRRPVEGGTRVTP